MATPVSMTTFDAYLKEWYIDKGNLYKMDDYGNELLGLMPKASDAEGDNWNVAVEAAGVVGDSALHADATAYATAGTDVKFMGLWKDRFASVFMEDKVLELSKSTKGAIVTATGKMDSLRKQFLESTNIQLFRDEGGSVGQLLNLSAGSTSAVASQSSGSLTDATKSMAQFLKKGTTLVVGTTSAGTSLRGGGTGTKVIVTNVNAVAGTFEVTLTTGVGDWPASTATTDYIFKAGDPGFALAGLASWIPETETAAATTFKSCNRAADVRALGGIRVDATGLTVEESVIQAVSDARQFGANPDAIFVHPKKHAQLIKELSGRISFQRTSGRDFITGKKTDAFGFSGLEVAVGGRPVLVYSDAACQSTLGWCLETKTLKFHTAGAWPHVRDKDGLKMLRQTDQNYKFELLGYGELLCFAPGHNVCIKFGS